MRDVLLTSSVLILAVLLIRFLFRKSISRRVQYALWALAVLRLLIPVNLPAMDHNVLTAAQPAYNAVTVTLEQPVTPAPATPETAQPSDSPVSPAGDPSTASPVSRPVRTADVLRIVWYGGMAAVALWFLLVNVRFSARLHRTRVPLEDAVSRYPVYLCDDIPSPCLFGLIRPAIYVTSEAARDPDRLRYVIAHEETHARHLDPLWSLLRSVCLVIWWFNPLVWLAGHFSRVDCELACDEGTLARLGETERTAYGETLLALIPVKHGADPLLAATTMTAGKRQIQDRITRITRHRKPILAALLAAILLTGIACACTFTGAKAALPYKSAKLCDEPTGEGYDATISFYHEEGGQRQWDWSMTFTGISPVTVDLMANPPRFDGDKSAWMRYDRSSEEYGFIGRCITTREQWDYLNRALFSAAYESDPSVRSPYGAPYAQVPFGTPHFELRQGNQCTRTTSVKDKDGEEHYTDDIVSTYYVLPDGDVIRVDPDESTYRAKKPLDRETVAYLYLLFEAYYGTWPIGVPYVPDRDQETLLLVERDGVRMQLPQESFDAFVNLITEDGNMYLFELHCFDCVTELFTDSDYPSPEVLRFRFVLAGEDPLDSSWWYSLRQDGKIIWNRFGGGGYIENAESWRTTCGKRWISVSSFDVDEIVALVEANGIK